MAARIEFEKEWLDEFEEWGKNKEPVKKNFKVNNPSTKTKALGSIKSEGLKDLFDNL